MVLPLYDEAPANRVSPPFVTFGLIAVNAVVFLIALSLPEASLEAAYAAYGLKPVAFTGPEAFFGAYGRYVDFVTYQFLHGGLLHFAGNMLFLWVFGDNVEDAFGHARFLAFYLLCGIAGGIVYVLSAPGSGAAMIGASGSTAGVLAAYLMIRPCAKVEVLLYVWPVKMAAYWVIGLWIASQILHVASRSEGDVAWWCHIGGLGAGALLTLGLRQPGVALFECMRPAAVPVDAKAPWTKRMGTRALAGEQAAGKPMD